MVEADRDGTSSRPVRAGEEVVVDIIDLAYGGRGVARVAGFVLFVAGALPGESVRARVTRSRAGYADGVCVEVLRPSRDRVTPPCGHYDVCGGCDLQHLAPAAQARAKGAQVRGLLARVAGLTDPPVSEAATAGDPYFYRFRMDFDWCRAGGAPALGLHRRGRPAEVVPITRCHLLPDPGDRILAFLTSEAAVRRLEPWDRRLHRGLLRRVGLQAARATGEILVTLETGRGDPPALGLLARDLVRRFPRVVGVVRREIDKSGRRVGESILAGRDHLFEVVEEDRFKVPHGAFFQTNSQAFARLRREVMAALEPRADEAILELYGGVGFFTLAVARIASEVTTVEGSRESAAAARDNAAAAGLGNVRVVCREVGEALPDLLAERPWGAILLDPPRAGLPPAAARALAASRVRRLVYVSCDPGTLARDLRILIGEGGYRLERVGPLDLFPQTGHVECVARLARGSAGGASGRG
jgi:23S rRNA (uracil1939-C5)-methyltransferase